MELIGIFSFRIRRSKKITFDLFIFAGDIFLVSRKLVPIFRQRTAVPSMLLRDSQTRQAKLSYLIEWHRLTLVLHQSHIPSRQACSKGIDLPSFDVQSFSRRTGTGHIGINPGGNDVLACRQVATVASALGKASHILAID